MLISVSMEICILMYFLWFYLNEKKNSGFNEKPEGKYEIRLKGSRTVLFGPYSVKGRILILPIQGSGISNITLCKCTSIPKYPNVLFLFSMDSTVLSGFCYNQRYFNVR